MHTTGPVEEYDEDSYLLTIDGQIPEPVKLSFAALQDTFPQIEVVAALQVRKPRDIYLRRTSALNLASG